MGVAARSNPRGLTKSRTKSARRGRRPQSVREQLTVFVEPVRHVQQPATRVEQILEVHGAVLVLLEIGHDDGVDRPSDNGRFDEGARIEPDDRGAVIQRVEVVGAGRFVHGIAAPHDGAEMARVDPFPLGHARRMRANEDAGVAQQRIAARSDRPYHSRTKAGSDALP